MTAKEIVDQYTKAWIRGDLAEARRLLADDLAFEGSMETHTSADAFVETGLRMFREKLFAGHTPLRRVDGEREVFKLYDCALVSGGSVRCAEYFRVDNDKIVEIKLTFDTARLPKPPTHTIRDEVVIVAGADKVRAALTTQAGYRGWWNTVAELTDTEAKLRFDKQGKIVNMLWRIDEVGADRVTWTCTAHDFPTWRGTQLTFRIRAGGDTTLFQLEHANFLGDEPAAVAQGWKHFIASLKSYVETGVGQPW